MWQSKYSGSRPSELKSSACADELLEHLFLISVVLYIFDRSRKPAVVADQRPAACQRAPPYVVPLGRKRQVHADRQIECSFAR